MKNLLEAYFSFNKPERLGLIALLSIIFILVIVRMMLHNLADTKPANTEQEKLRREWSKFKGEHTIKPETYVPRGKMPTTEKKPLVKSRTEPVLFQFDPNTIDSAGLRKLGLKERTTSILLHWREKGKIFRRKEELRKVYTLTEAEYQRLEPYIVIDHQ